MITESDVVQFLADRLEINLPPRAVSIRRPAQGDVGDATLKCEIRAGDFHAHLQVSAAVAPQLIARGVANIERVRRRLPPKIAASVLPPLATGEIAGRSAAVWDWYPSLNGSNRLVRRARLRWYRAALLDWAHDFMAAGIGSPAGDNAVASRFCPLLERMAADAGQDEDIRQSARTARARIESGRWRRLFNAIEHGDLWQGNFLLAEGDATPFYVIDWAGAQLDGFPVFDLARLSLSIGVDEATARRIARRFADALDCAPEDLIGYALCSLSDLSTRLEHFPPERFRAMARDVHRHVRAIAA